MDLLPENSPESCSNIGLDCGTCIHRSAASVAAICGGLESAGLQQIFFQLYPAPGCHAMAQAFALAYQESSVAQKPVLAFASAAA
ncbi:MAG TPA: hypothetical protein VLW25_04485 [Bryobacteraceae bacterium]|nr:hypothetical protein [Bryobacteraceae bacterium]